MVEAVSGLETLELSGEELMLVRLSSALAGEEESPLPPLESRPDAARLESSARSLVKRGLADRRSYRPHREILRRILVVAQPDARVVLLAVGPGQAERRIDVYERAQVFVSYQRQGDRHRFGPPLEFVDLHDEVAAHFTARRSTGDFIALDLDPPEYAVFSAAARNLATRGKGRSARLERDMPLTGLNDTSLDGAVLMPGKSSRFVPGGGPEGAPRIPISAIEWQAAIGRLEKKGVLQAEEGGHHLRPFLHDLADGLTRRTRYVLTRFDYGEGDWIVRDAIFVPVDGSLFLLKPTREQGLTIRELDAAKLERALKAAIEALPDGDTAS
jgi:hypothetical protein